VSSTIIPAQPGFASVSPWNRNEHGKADARLFEYTPIIAWRITTHSEDDVTVVRGIGSSGCECDRFLLRPDGDIDDLEHGYTHPTADALADAVNKNWERLDAEREPAAVTEI
jgi:hypothetical protein